MKRRRSKDFASYVEGRLGNIEAAHHVLAVNYQRSQDSYLDGIHALNLRLETQLAYIMGELGSTTEQMEKSLSEFIHAQGSVNTALHNDILTTKADGLSFAENRVRSLNEALVSHIGEISGRLETLFSESLKASERGSREAIGRILATLDNFRVIQERLQLRSHSTSDSIQPESSNQSGFDSTLYADFEARFRGSQEDIRDRFSAYIDVLDLIPRSGQEFLDLGCGRGEFLDFLRQRQIPCRGLDSDAVAVEQCIQKGLRAEVGDLVSYLSELADHSVAGISMLHVIEHLPVQVAVAVLREVHRVIIPDGVIIIETPNPKNLRVGSSTFWLDPTHLRPFPPELTSFLLETVGFVELSAKFLRSNVDLYDITPLEPTLRALFEVVLTAIDGPADYAIVAKKPTATSYDAS